MSCRYMKFSFMNAKLFPKNEKTKDFVSNVGVNKKGKLTFNRSSRSESKQSNFVEPITMFQVSNFLHTLVGERPVPSFRSTFYEMDKDILELSKNSLLRIDTPKTSKNVKGEQVEIYIEEFTKVNKSATDSWTNHNTIQWFKIKKYMNESFDEFLKIINNSLGYDVMSRPFEELRNSYQKYGDKLDDVISFLKANKKTPIINFLSKEKFQRAEITMQNVLRETIISGIDNVNILDGVILVPYKEEFANRLVRNTTNILDGGYIKLDGIFYEDELNDLDGFRLVSEISIDKH